MSVYSDVRTAIRNGTLKVFQNIGLNNVPIIFSHQNGSEPADPYVVIQIVNVRQVGRTQEASFTDDGDEFGENKNLWYTAQYEVMAQFSFSGSLGPDYAQEFQHAVNNNRVIIEEYQKFNLAPIRKSLLRRAPMKRETQWIEFFNIDVTFSYAVQTIQSIDWVEHVSIKDSNTGEVIIVPPITP